MKRRGGGKAKGSSFERQVCKALSLWVSHGENEDAFWRSAISGGRATVGRRAGKDLARQAGDITATAPEAHVLTDRFFIECKFVKTLGIANFVYMRGCPIRGFWDKAEEQAKEHNRAPMLIAKENQGPVLVVMLSTDARGYAWATRAALSRIAIDKERSVAVLDFELMCKQQFSMRYKI